MLLPGQRIYPVNPHHLWSNYHIKVLSRCPSLYQPERMMLLVGIEGFPQPTIQWEEDFQAEPPLVNKTAQSLTGSIYREEK